MGVLDGIGIRTRETQCDHRANGGCENLATKTCDTSLDGVVIESIRFLRYDVKYDITVPNWHNYWAEGCFHHNSGKTHCLIASIIALMCGYYPWDPDKKTRFTPPIRVRLLGGDLTHHIGQTLIPKIKAFFPKKFLAHVRKNNQGIEYFWTHTNGSTLEIMSYEQDDEAFESWNGHVAGYDEPPPREKYVANNRGLVDNDGISLFAFTPLSQPWIHDDIVSNPDPSIAFFFASTHDNPHLSKQAIQEFEKTLSEEERAARIKGEWLFLQGLVYPEFKRQTHVIKPILKIPEDHTCFALLDTHPRAPHALSFFSVDEKNRIFQVDEKFSHGTPLEIADWIIEFHKHRHKITGVIIEPASKGDSNRGDSTFEVIDKALATHNIWLETGSRDLSGGILLVKEALQSRNGVASFFLCENCTQTLREFERYVWDDWKQSGLKTEKQRPRDKDDHFMENLRRAIQHPIEYSSSKVLSGYLAQANRPYRPVDSVAGY